MTLNEEEYKEFLNTNLDLLFYVGQKKGILAEDINLKKFLNLDFKIKFKCRDAFLEDETLLDEYIASNFDHLTTEQIKILRGFKKKIRINFVILNA